MKLQLEQYRDELNGELQVLLQWWLQYAVDKKNGGFYGSVNNQNVPDTAAEKGLILNARILWAFSAAYRCFAKKEYWLAASRQFHYMTKFFYDQVYDGFYYSIAPDGKPLQKQKSVMAHGYVIYALSEYTLCSNNTSALDLAQYCYRLIEQKAYDAANGGYHEALTQEWALPGHRNGKQIYAHLHLLEAYTNLYHAWHDKEVLLSMNRLLNLFTEKIVCTKTGNVHLSFFEKW